MSATGASDSQAFLQKRKHTDRRRRAGPGVDLKAARLAFVFKPATSGGGEKAVEARDEINFSNRMRRLGSVYPVIGL